MPSRPANVSLIHRRCSGRSAAPGREDNPSPEPHPLTFRSMSERLTQCGFRLEEFEADQAAADREEGLVDVVAAFVADPQPSVLVQPGDRALDDPALLA